MESHEVTGGCYCGKVRYRAQAEPLISTVCYCVDCRRAAGAQSVAWVTFPTDRFSFTGQEPAAFASSPGVTRTFCPTCGTSLTYTNVHRPNEIDVTTASLDDPNAFPPKELVFAGEKLSWDQHLKLP